MRFFTYTAWAVVLVVMAWLFVGIREELAYVRRGSSPAGFAIMMALVFSSMVLAPCAPLLVAESWRAREHLRVWERHVSLAVAIVACVPLAFIAVSVVVDFVLQR